MQSSSTRSHLLAPAALLAAVVALVIVVATSLNGSGDGGDRRLGGERTERTSTKSKDFGNSYEVRAGDTLTTISELTGVPIDRLQQLNPELDPQALIEGQKVKLR